jgi:hypothetical protein
MRWNGNSSEIFDDLTRKISYPNKIIPFHLYKLVILGQNKFDGKSFNRMNQHYRYFCIAIGVLIGVFIQFSSLCANTYYYVLFLILRNTNQEDDSIAAIDASNITIVETSMTWTFSLLWSVLTSSVGVVLLLTLRALVITTMNYNLGVSKQKISSLMRNMEHSVASGTLWGVSLAWIATDAILGLSIRHHPNPSDLAPDQTHVFFHGNTFWYVPTLISVIALLGWHIMLKVTSRMVIEKLEVVMSDDISTPLLRHEPLDCSDCQDDDASGECHCVALNMDKSIDDAASKVSCHNPSVRRYRTIQFISLCFGGLVGIVIQCSTLGATFVAQFVWFRQWHDDGDADLAQELMQMFEVMSILWSFVTSCMGILLLLFVRALLLWILHYPSEAPAKGASGAALREDDATASTLLHVESFFATGTVLGLNVAWMMTDRVVSYHSRDAVSSHWIESVYTFVLSSLWCQVILYCSGYYSPSSRHDEWPSRRLLNDEEQGTLL